MLRYYRVIIALIVLWVTAGMLGQATLPSPSRSAGTPSGFRLLGRLFARVLWHQSEVFRDTGRWWMVLPLLRITTFLDPTFAEAYDFAGWHIAYNLRAEEKEERHRVRWVKLGLQVYEEGLKRNPNDFSLLFGIGWTAYDKLGDLYLAAYYLERALKAPGKFTKDIDWVRHMLAHAYERLPNMRLALYHWKRAAIAAPNNPVARGATITIAERYTGAEAMMESGYYEEAIAVVEHLLQRPDRKFGTIERHMLAKIYEKAGDLESALAVLELMTEWHKLEPRARFKADLIREKLQRRELRGRD